MSVLREGNVDLDEYRPQIESASFFGVELVRGHLYSYFPEGPSFVVLPLLAPADLVCRLIGIDLLPIVTGPRCARIESHLAAIVVAFTTVVLFAALRRAGITIGHASAAVLIFAFCTTVWSTASRALWQHGPSMLAISAALYCVFGARTRPQTLVLAGAFLACAWILRPTNAIALALLTSLVVLRYKRQLPGFLLTTAIPTALFVLHSKSIWGSLLPPYYQPGRLMGESALAEALAGNLVSPARGLLIFTPVVLVAGFGMVAGLAKGATRTLDTLLVLTVILHWIIISTFPHWWAGHSYGPRLFTDTMPYFTYFIAVAFTQFGVLPLRLRRFAWAVACVLATTSFCIHYKGANSHNVHWWNSRPVDVDEHPERVWDWGDLQFLR